MTPCDIQPLRFPLLRLLRRGRRIPEPRPAPPPPQPPVPEVIGAAWPPAEKATVFASY